MVPFGYLGLCPQAMRRIFGKYVKQQLGSVCWGLRCFRGARASGLGLSYKGINGVATSFYGGGNSHIFLTFTPKIPNLTHIFSKGLKPPTTYILTFCMGNWGLFHPYKWSFGPPSCNWIRGPLCANQEVPCGVMIFLNSPFFRGIYLRYNQIPTSNWRLNFSFQRESWSNLCRHEWFLAVSFCWIKSLRIEAQ